MGIEWRDSMSVGVELIDNQHKELLNRFDMLLKACQSGKGIAELKILQSFLGTYVFTHFSDEEHLQRLHNYPAYEAHKAEHDHFVERIKKLMEETEEAGISTHHVIETNSLLLNWLLNHISKIDTQLGDFLRSKNL